METTLKYLLMAMALVAFITGLNVLIGGASAVPGANLGAEATVDNELRFFSVFWMAYGGFCFWVGRNLEASMHFIPFIAIVFLIGGIGRLMSTILVGMPSTPLVGAMILEFILPIVLFTLFVKLRKGLTPVSSGV